MLYNTNSFTLQHHLTFCWWYIEMAVSYLNYERLAWLRKWLKMVICFVIWPTHSRTSLPHRQAAEYVLIPCFPSFAFPLCGYFKRFHQFRFQPEPSADAILLIRFRPNTLSAWKDAAFNLITIESKRMPSLIWKLYSEVWIG